LHLKPRRKKRFPAGPLQQTPYFAIDTKHVRLVCIDTGITGTVDKAQAEWLLEVSADGKDGRVARPKVLLTGKPLLVDRVRRQADLEEPLATGDAHFTSVDEIVRSPDHRYVAAIGGDIHNFQHYDDSTEDRQFHYVVSGGGGAYMSATHPLVLADEDAPVATQLYPDAAPSLIHFARLLLPGYGGCSGHCSSSCSASLARRRGSGAARTPIYRSTYCNGPPWVSASGSWGDRSSHLPLDARPASGSLSASSRSRRVSRWAWPDGGWRRHGSVATSRDGPC
jgi:hypothetical protein